MKIRRWNKQDIDYLSSNYAILPMDVLVYILGRTENSIRLKANRLGLTRDRRLFEQRKKSPRYWTKEEIDMLKSEYPVGSTRILADKLGRSVQALTLKASNVGLVKKQAIWPPKPDNLRKYVVNRQAFSNVTPEIAYVVGFFLADGSIRNNGLSFANTNRQILEKIRDILESNHPIREETKGKCSWNTLFIGDKTLRAGIIKLNLVPNKSLIAEMPNIPESVFPHFLRGYFDGDGSSRYGKRSGLTIKFTSGSRVLLEQLSLRILSNMGISGSSVKCDKNRKAAWRLYYCGSKALRISNIMYRRAGNLFIERKRLPFLEYAAR